MSADLVAVKEMRSRKSPLMADESTPRSNKVVQDGWLLVEAPAAEYVPVAEVMSLLSTATMQPSYSFALPVVVELATLRVILPEPADVTN